MKAERRHEIQTNDLAIWLKNTIEKIGPFKNLIFGGVVILLVAVFLVSYLSGMGEKKQARAWSHYFEYVGAGGDPETIATALGDVGDLHSDTEAGLWAWNSAGIRFLDQGSKTAFSDREQSKSNYESAKEYFEKVVNQATDDQLRQRALMGLAQSQEALAQFDDAITSYQEIAEKYPSSVLAEIAQKHADRISNSKNQDWYRWFAAQKSVGVVAPDPSLFNDIDNLPSDPNIPEPGNLIKPDGSNSPGLDLNLGDATDSAEEADLNDLPDATTTETDSEPGPVTIPNPDAEIENPTSEDSTNKPSSDVTESEESQNVETEPTEEPAEPNNDSADQNTGDTTEEPTGDVERANDVSSESSDE